MKRFFDYMIPKAPLGGVLHAIGITGSLLILLFKLSSYLHTDALFLYGTAIFFGAPFFIGVITPMLAGYHKPLGMGESFAHSLLALVGVGALFLVFAVEGLICLIMAFPIAAVFTLVGSLVGYSVTRDSIGSSNTKLLGAFALFVFFLPSGTLLEGRLQGEQVLMDATTAVEINAPPEVVWRNVVEFSELPPPTEAVFQTGIAYPIRARIEGSGVGAVRHCIFTTGSFVEPITVWNEPNLLGFSVQEQPFPMREISLYEHLDTAHLHDYLVSKKGQFKLTRTENGGTRLEGTTWYYHRIKPDFYWQHWSNFVIHSIHQRVLNHIKLESEKQASISSTPQI